jgi:hypothetical protein
MHSPLSIPSLAEEDANAIAAVRSTACYACKRAIAGNAMPALKSKKHAKSRSTRPVPLGNTKPTVPYLPREQKPILTSSRPENSPLVALAPLSRRLAASGPFPWRNAGLLLAASLLPALVCSWLS